MTKRLPFIFAAAVPVLIMIWVLIGMLDGTVRPVILGCLVLLQLMEATAYAVDFARRRADAELASIKAKKP